MLPVGALCNSGIEFHNNSRLQTAGRSAAILRVLPQSIKRQQCSPSTAGPCQGYQRLQRERGETGLGGGEQGLGGCRWGEPSGDSAFQILSPLLAASPPPFLRLVPATELWRSIVEQEA